MQILALENEHQRLKAKMAPFAGFHMPIAYGSIAAEHLAVREGVGIFDVSHMGEIRVQGPDAFSFLDRLLPCNLAALKVGQVRYTPALNEAGGVVDDLLVYRLEQNDFLLVVNACNTQVMFEWLQSGQGALGGACDLRDETALYGLLAVQGPKAAGLMEAVGLQASQLGYYHCQWMNEAGDPWLVSRTGYTGEDGFEILVPVKDVTHLWRTLLGQRDFSPRPAGLGCRDTLRLEVCFPLYGHELNAVTTPYESGIGWAIDAGKRDYVGYEALRQKAPQKALMGFEMLDQGIAREGCPVFLAGEACASVTSGSYLPSVKKNMGLCLLPLPRPAPGTPLSVEIRTRRLSAQVVSRPFITPFQRRKK